MTTNKNLNQPAFNSTAWDVPLNSNFGIIDAALGSSAALTTTNGTYDLVAAEYQCLILTISGTLLGNVIYRLPSGKGGQWIVVNNATMGAFTITIANVAGGASFSMPAANKVTLFSDGTNIYQPSANVTTGSVTTASLADGAVTTVKLANNAVMAPQLASDAVTTAKVINAAITYAKIQNTSASNVLLGRTSVGAGAVEEVSIGSSANNIVSLDATAKLPAVDGSQLTNINVGAFLAALSSQAIGMSIWAHNAGSSVADNGTTSASNLRTTYGFANSGVNWSVSSSTPTAGTWRNITGLSIPNGGIGMWMRIA